SGNTSAFSNALPAVPITIQLGAAMYSASETDGAIAITVTRTGGQGGNVAVDFAVGGGTAVAGIDYSPVSGTLFFNAGDLPSKTANATATAALNYTRTAGTLTFSPGETTKTVNVPILNDNLVGPPLSFHFTLSGPTGGILGAPASTTITINNTNAPGTLQLSS